MSWGSEACRVGRGLVRLGLRMPEPVRIAVVEDDAVYLAALVRRLAAQPGWSVAVACTDAGEALRKVPAVRPDLIIADLHLNGALRVDLVKEFKRVLPAVPVVALTVADQAEVIVEVIQAGCSGYLLKDDPVSVLEGIQTVLDGGAPAMSPAVARRLWEAATSAAEPKVSEQILSRREWQVLDLAAKGQKHVRIAASLGIKLNTVRNHFRSIYEKLNVHSLNEALIKVRGNRGLLDG